MRGEELYSLKWYRDNVEFYRYIPSGEKPSLLQIQVLWFWSLSTEVPSLTVFVMPGLEVLDYSSPTHIVLNNVVRNKSRISLQTSPRYMKSSINIGLNNVVGYEMTKHENIHAKPRRSSRHIWHPWYFLWADANFIPFYTNCRRF